MNGESISKNFEQETSGLEDDSRSDIKESTKLALAGFHKDLAMFTFYAFAVLKNRPSCSLHKETTTWMVSAQSLSLSIHVFLNPFGQTPKTYSKSWENQDLENLIPGRYSESTEFAASIRRSFEKKDIIIRPRSPDNIKVEFPGVIELSLTCLDHESGTKHLKDLFEKAILIWDGQQLVFSVISKQNCKIGGRIARISGTSDAHTPVHSDNRQTVSKRKGGPNMSLLNPRLKMKAAKGTEFESDKEDED
ncbi:hypothetical protein HK096_000208 [Nowakowskiella sp. JEL0078]|nr:hypothetical protein HK096_000208 [Nowakowskiella sp. JEL0078]